MSGWEPVDDWPAYQINTRTVAVRSVKRIDCRGRRWPGKVLRLSVPRPASPGSRSGGKAARVTLSNGKHRQTFYPHSYLSTRKVHAHDG